MADFWIHFNGALRRRLPYLIIIPYFTLKINRKFNEIHNFCQNEYVSDRLQNQTVSLQCAHKKRCKKTQDKFFYTAVNIVSAAKHRRFTAENIVFLTAPLFDQYSAFPTVRGYGITSRIFDTPVRYIMIRSNPSPYPACLVPPKRLRFTYHQ